MLSFLKLQVSSSGQNFGREWHEGGHRGGRQNYGPPNNHGKKVGSLLNCDQNFNGVSYMTAENTRLHVVN